MAISQVEAVAKPAHSSSGLGGMISSGIGLAGLAAAPFTDGVSLQVAGPLASAAQIGGQMLDPSKAGNATMSIAPTDTSQVAPPPKPMEMGNPMDSINTHPDVMMANMQAAKQVLQASSSPEAEGHIDILNQGMQKLAGRSTYGGVG